MFNEKKLQKLHDENDSLLLQLNASLKGQTDEIHKRLRYQQYCGRLLNDLREICSGNGTILKQYKDEFDVHKDNAPFIEKNMR